MIGNWLNFPEKFCISPNFWPNTPDILPECLQFGGRPAFIVRHVLAATLSSNYGMYGPAFELCDGEAHPEREEYKNNEKYELKSWDLYQPGNIRNIIRRVNQIRLDTPALQRTFNLKFVECDNPSLLAYLKYTRDLLSIVLVIVNLDFNKAQDGCVTLPLQNLNMDLKAQYLVQDMLPEPDGTDLPEANFMCKGHPSGAGRKRSC